MQAKHGAAAPSYPLFSSFFVASTSSSLPRPLKPTHHPQPLFSLFPSPFVCPLFVIPSLRRTSSLFSFVPLALEVSGISFPPSSFPSFHRSSRLLPMLECSMLQYITYTLLPVHLFHSFSRPRPIHPAPPTASLSRSIGGPISLLLFVSFPPSICLRGRKGRALFATRSSLRGNVAAAAAGKFLLLSIFGKLPPASRIPRDTTDFV